MGNVLSAHSVVPEYGILPLEDRAGILAEFDPGYPLLLSAVQVSAQADYSVLSVTAASGSPR